MSAVTISIKVETMLTAGTHDHALKTLKRYHYRFLCNSALMATSLAQSLPTVNIFNVIQAAIPHYLGVSTLIYTTSCTIMV